MGSKRQYSDLRTLSKEPLDFEELITLLTTARNLEPRGAVLVVTSQLETALERALLTKLPNLDSDNFENLFHDYRPLANFYPQIWLAHALGLIGDLTRDDLEEIRHMRNQFAHAARHVDFDNPIIVAHCEKITLPERAGSIVPRFQFGNWPPVTMQDRFIETALAYWEAFMNVATSDPKVWPLD